MSGRNAETRKEVVMEIKGKCAVVTGAASGIGQAVAVELANRGVRGIGLADRSDSVYELASRLNAAAGRQTFALPFIGDATDPVFRRRVFDEVQAKCGIVGIVVPAAGITRDALSVKLDKATG